MLRQFINQVRRLLLFRRLPHLRTYFQHTGINQGITELVGKRILILSPHPDDESLGCGGTIALLTKGKALVTVAFLTSGEKGYENAGSPPEDASTLQRKRRGEAFDACSILGVKDVLFLEGSDTGLHLEVRMGERILGLLKQGYDAVFCPWPFDGHSDHSATFRHLASALRRHQGKLRVWLYEVDYPLIANQAVDIGPSLKDKLRAINAHSSQHKNGLTAKRAEALAVYRSIHCPGADFAETFFILDRKEVLKLRDA